MPEDKVLGTARETIWPLMGWKVCLGGFIEAIKDKVTVLSALILMCHLMTLTMEGTRLSLVLRYSSRQLFFNKAGAYVCNWTPCGAPESPSFVK